MANMFLCFHFNASWPRAKSLELGLVLGAEVLVLVSKVVLVLVLPWCLVQSLDLVLNDKLLFHHCDEYSILHS
jgi:hypothetical protein